MRIDAFIDQPNHKRLKRACTLAEIAGFDGITIPEITNDPFISAAIAADATEKVDVRTGIAVAFPRSPMNVATSAWQLHENSAGRFVLGIGTQVKGHIERRFSTAWTKPYPRLRDYVWALRAIWASWQDKQPLNFTSDNYAHTLMTPEFAPKPSTYGPIPIHTAAVRPAMLRLAGRVSDGVRLHGFCTRMYLDDVVLPNLQAGLDRVDRERETFEVCGGGFIATGPDEEAVAKRVEWVRYRLAFYGSTRTYSPVLEAHGWHDLGAELHAMSKQGRWAEMAARIDDDVVRQFTAVATFENLAAEVERRFAGLTDRIDLFAPADEKEAATLADVLDDIRRLPRRYKGLVSEA